MQRHRNDRFWFPFLWYRTRFFLFKSPTVAMAHGHNLPHDILHIRAILDFLPG